jgi:hypothetical protein
MLTARKQHSSVHGGMECCAGVDTVDGGHKRACTQNKTTPTADDRLLQNASKLPHS